ncbi:hypothetical protein GOBAR_AA33116 [Gossypium barbadense]|uniref:Importin N-terminal domain-containing protein n=1 Tax=Gossypium barbadense TaxID=3634 RepID=A0A2P5W901_GOSBA|nr:hypothetical protein GOBAR_AA33116 [Gossypium barbadense]
MGFRVLLMLGIVIEIQTYGKPIDSLLKKAIICGLLLSTLDDPNRKLCIAISMVVAAIAVYDWPESWPDLLSFLLKLIGDQTSMNRVREKELKAKEAELNKREQELRRKEDAIAREFHHQVYLLFLLIDIFNTLGSRSPIC